MMRRVMAAALPAAAAVALVIAGCSKRQNALGPNQPPETTVFLQGPVDTVNYRIHIYWFGSDPDGDVVAYHMRFVPTAGDTNPPWDTLWCAMPGRCTDSVFTVPTFDSTLIHSRFEIRAMDDDGAVDPSPAVQSFLLSNLPPVVTLTSPYGSPDTTYASVTATWDARDPDGSGLMYFRVWLDGNEANYDSTSERRFTVPSSRFLRNGTYLSGPRTLFVQAVDAGELAGAPVSMTWYVRAPAAILTPDLRGELLVVDEVPSAGQANATYDAFYLGVVGDSLAGRFSVIRPEIHRRIFRSTRDFAQTLRQFKAVLWYRGQEPIIDLSGRRTDSLLVANQDSLEAYLDQGGNVYLDGLYLVQGLRVPGSLTEGFVTRRLRSSGMYNVLDSDVADSTAGWSNRGNALFRSSIYGDVMRATFIATDNPGPGQPSGIRAFIPAVDTNSVAVWAMESQLVPPNVGFEAPVGVSVAQPGGGRLIFISMPLRIGQPAPAGRMLRRMLYGYTSGSISTPGLIQR